MDSTAYIPLALAKGYSAKNEGVYFHVTSVTALPIELFG